LLFWTILIRQFERSWETLTRQSTRYVGTSRATIYFDLKKSDRA